jgi:hypothetical protein
MQFGGSSFIDSIAQCDRVKSEYYDGDETLSMFGQSGGGGAFGASFPGTFGASPRASLSAFESYSSTTGLVKASLSDCDGYGIGGKHADVGVDRATCDGMIPLFSFDNEFGLQPRSSSLLSGVDDSPSRLCDLPFAGEEFFGYPDARASAMQLPSSSAMVVPSMKYHDNHLAFTTPTVYSSKRDIGLVSCESDMMSGSTRSGVIVAKMMSETNDGDKRCVDRGISTRMMSDRAMGLLPEQCYRYPFDPMTLPALPTSPASDRSRTRSETTPIAPFSLSTGSYHSRSLGAGHTSDSSVESTPALITKQALKRTFSAMRSETRNAALKTALDADVKEKQPPVTIGLQVSFVASIGAKKSLPCSMDEMLARAMVHLAESRWMVKPSDVMIEVNRSKSVPDSLCERQQRRQGRPPKKSRRIGAPAGGKELRENERRVVLSMKIASAEARTRALEDLTDARLTRLLSHVAQLQIAVKGAVFDELKEITAERLTELNAVSKKFTAQKAARCQRARRSRESKRKGH